MYLSRDDKNKPEYNDVLVLYDDRTYESLKQHGELANNDSSLSIHFNLNRCR